MRDGAAAAINEAEETLKAQLKEQVAALRDSAEYKQWREGVFKVAELAQVAAPSMRDLLDRQRAQKDAAYDKAAKEARDIGGRKFTLADEIKAKEHELETLVAQRPLLDAGLPAQRTEVQSLDSQILDKASAMKLEEGGIVGGRKSGRGKEWNRLNVEYKKLVEERTIKADRLKDGERRVAELDKRIAALGEGLSKDRLLFADIDSSIARANEQAGVARAARDAMGARGGADIGIAQLRDLPNRFEATADPAYLAQAEASCTQFYDNMKDLSAVSGQLAGLSCDRGPIMPKVSAILGTRSALDDLNAHCSGPGAKPFHEMPFAEALSAARACLDLSKLPYGAIRAEREELDRLKREEGANASPFTRTINALFAGEKLAFFALIIALSMDLLVLFTGLIGAKSATATFTTRVLEPERTDDPQQLAIKALINSVDAFVGNIDGVRYVGKVDLESIRAGRERDLVGQLLRRNAAKGMVLAAKEDEQSNLFYLRWDALEQLEEQLRKRDQQAASPPEITAVGYPRSGVGSGGRAGGFGERPGPLRGPASGGAPVAEGRRGGFAGVVTSPRSERVIRPAVPPVAVPPVQRADELPLGGSTAAPPSAAARSAAPVPESEPWDLVDDEPIPTTAGDRAGPTMTTPDPPLVTATAEAPPVPATTSADQDLVHQLLFGAEPAPSGPPPRRS